MRRAVATAAQRFEGAGEGNARKAAHRLAAENAVTARRWRWTRGCSASTSWYQKLRGPWLPRFTTSKERLSNGSQIQGCQFHRWKGMASINGQYVERKAAIFR
eukprot:6197267-Pleurochrysis_carterae.AAC.4